MDEKEAIRDLIQSGELPTPAKVRAILEKPIKKSEKKIEVKELQSSVEVIKQFEYTPGKIQVPDFTKYFRPAEVNVLL